MAGKLKDDEIKWILSLDASKTQQEIHKVTLESKELANTNKALAKDMRDLEAQGKKNGEAWNNLKSSYDQNSKSIATNTLKIKEHEKTLGYDNMTMQQLKKTSNDLLKQLDNTSKSLHPEAYAKLEKELQAVAKAKVNLKGKTDDVGTALNKGAASFSSFISAAKSGDVVGMIPALGKYAAVIGLVAGALGFAKSVMESTRATSKEFKADMEGLSTSWTYFLKAVASGDFTFSKMIEAFQAGHDFKIEMGGIVKEQQALTVEEAKNYVKIQGLLEIQRDVTKTVQERKKAGDEILKLTSDEGKLKQDVASKSYDAAMKRMTALTGLSKSDYESFMEGYNKKEYHAFDKSAAMYTKLKSSLKDFTKSPLEIVKGTSFEDAYTTYYNHFMELMKKGNKEITGQNLVAVRSQVLESMFSNDVKVIARTQKAYGKTTKDEIDNIVDLQVKAIRVPGEVIAETMRVRRTNHKLEKDMTDEQIAKEKEQAEKRKKAGDAQKKILDDQLAARQRVFEDASKQLKAEEQDNNVRLKAADLFGKELVNMTKEQLAEKLRLEELYIANIQKITIDAENSRYARLKKDTGISSDQSPENSGLKGDKLKAYEIIYKEHQAILTDIVVQSEKKREDIETAVDKAVLDSLNRSNTAQLKTIEATINAKLQYAKTEFANGKLSKKKYDSEVDRINSEGLDARLQAQQEFNDLLAGLEMAATPEYIAALQASQKAVAETQSQIDDQKIKQHEKFENEKKKITTKYGKDSILGEYEIKKAALQKEYDEGLVSEQEFQDEKLKLKLNAAKKFTDQVGSLVTAGSNFVTALQSAETATVQADYQKRLAGLNESDADYAAKKEKLQHDQAVAELEVQKKYADAQFGIQVAQIGVATATGIMNAWSTAMELPAPFNIMAGVAMTGLLVGTAAAQVAAAAAERNKIKSMTVDSSSSSSTSSNKTGTVVVNNPGFADGGYTGDGEKYEVAGYAHKREYVVAQEEMSNPVTASYVRKIDNVKQQRSKRNPLPAGFADGGYTGDSNSSGNNGGRYDSFIVGLENWLAELKSTKVEAEINYWEFKKSSALAEEYKGLGARK